ncbi:hypothetical protein PR202_gb04203 [Eleusine coracana subsp. coracana]|uniref:Sphingomyelin synthase-like domain-containing protein n=1 Tax=Eleusine coracana subsp. coracana TaxID=191504 RepID=A0AAV5E3W8_ELECO|nr:hypothetical protein PR202_gb04203 [Eleusine coracana subsp. coracana]
MVVSPSETSGGLGAGAAAMTVYVAREATKLWRKVSAETALELQLLLEKWRLLLAGLVFQIHAIILPIISTYMDWLLEEYITCIGPDHCSKTWDLWPFRSLAEREVLLARAYSLPSSFPFCWAQTWPLFHPPNNILEVLVINFPRGVNFGCGDLIFSSHMIFTLVFIRTYHKYGANRLIKLLGWLMAIVQSLLIIASRKHYTVDVVVAWYTVNLVVFFVDNKLPEMPDRTNGLPLLPVSVKDKEGRMKEELHKLEKDSRMRDEYHKLLNGNTNDATDRV